MNTDTPVQETRKYVLLDLIGAGGMAEVYRCKLSCHQGVEKLIVLKKLHSQVANDPEIVANFIDEARLAALLQHDNIATVYDFGEMDGSYFIAMEYLFGKDLHAIIARTKELGSQMQVELALLVASKICAAMEYAHNLNDLQQRPLNIIHRDLTPHNVFITYEGKVKIIDFGIARADLFDNRTKAGKVKGKISYMSPEQLTGEEVDRRSDIFSIGILLYEMLSGRKMYSGDTAALIRKCMKVEYEPLEAVLPGLYPGIYTVLNRTLEKDREGRYQSCGEMKNAIDDCLFAVSEKTDSLMLKNFIRQLFKNEFETEKVKVFARPRTRPAIDDGVDDELTKGENTFPVDQSVVERTVIQGDVTRRGMGRWTKIFVGTLLGLGILCLSYWSLDQLHSQIATKQPEAMVKEDQSHAGGPIKGEREGAPERLMEELHILQGKAQQAMVDQRLTVPEHDSAFGYFQRILAIDPGNSLAREGIRQIGEKYAELADSALSKDNFSDALAYIGKGLVVSPRSGRLLALKDRIQKEKQQLITTLSKKARQSMTKNSLTTPVGNCAYDYYREILRLDGGNRQALKGMQDIGDRYALLAENAFRNMKVNASRRFVEKGLQVVPNHTHLLQLQRDLEKSKPEVFLKSLEKQLGTLLNGIKR